MYLRYEKVSPVLIIAQPISSKISRKRGTLIKLLRPTDLNTIALRVANSLKKQSSDVVEEIFGVSCQGFKF